MKTKIVRNGRMVEVTVYVNRKNIYHRELERLLNEVSLTPYSRLRFTNDVECYLQDKPHYIEETAVFRKSRFYQFPKEHFLSIKRKVADDVRNHLKRMM